MKPDPSIRIESTGLQILRHHIYEYKKGVRSMILHTLKKREEFEAVRILIKRNIDYFVVDVNENKINIFFGDEDCIEIIKSFGNKPLNKLSEEQDFMLGIMLGYNRKIQYKRYLERMELSSRYHRITSAG